MRTNILLFTAILLLSLCGCKSTKVTKSSDTAAAETKHNTLSSEDIKNGFVLLFDGKTTDGWHNWNDDDISGWIVEDGCLVGQGLGGDIGGDIISEKEYDNFHLKWEWKLGPNGNSGVMYHVVEELKYKAAYETGPEYQMIEDDDFRDEHGDHYPLEDWQKTGADYAMYVASEKKQVNLRGWNTSAIVFTPEKVEYWLNGEVVVEFVPWSEDWYERRNSGKWDQYPDYGLSKTGNICLQDHGSKIRFRNIKIKEL